MIKPETRENIHMTLLVMTMLGAFLLSISLAFGSDVSGENMIWSGIGMSVGSLVCCAIGLVSMHVASRKHVQSMENGL